MLNPSPNHGHCGDDTANDHSHPRWRGMDPAVRGAARARARGLDRVKRKLVKKAAREVTGEGWKQSVR